MESFILRQLEESWLLRNLTEEQKRQLLANSNVVKYKNRDIIFKQNTRTSHLVFILSGLVKIFKESRNNKILSIKTLSPGNFASLFSIFGNSIYQYSASSIFDSEVLMIDYATFVSIMQDNGHFAMNIIKQMGKDGLFLTNRMMSLSSKQLPGRIAEVILYFSEEIYGADEYDFPLTRQELAELAGTTKESFIRTINEFKHDKIIDLEGRRVKIISMDIIKVLNELG
jgi:CRP-like cAMP-binding protein